MNVFTATGRLGRDCRVNQTQGGTTVCNFALAVDAGYGDNKQTVWLDCSLWGKRAEGQLPGYLVKGTQVAVSGELATRDFQDANGQNRTAVTLRVNDLSLIYGYPKGVQTNQSGQQQNATQQPQQGFGNAQGAPAPQPNNPPSNGFDDFDSDIPFN